MDEILEAEYIRMETENNSILKKVQAEIGEEYLYINKPKDTYLIRLILRRYNFNALTYFRKELEKLYPLPANESFINEFLTVENEFIDQDDDCFTSWPIPFDPELFQSYGLKILENYTEREEKYIWILKNYRSDILGERCKLTCDHSNFHWRFIGNGYNEEMKDFCKWTKSNGEIIWINLIDNLEPDEAIINVEKINIDNEMKNVLTHGIKFCKIASQEKLKIYKSD